MKEIEELNIPAFQRKKSIQKKIKESQKKPSLTTRKPRPARTKKITLAEEISIPTSPFASLSSNQEITYREFKIIGFCERHFDSLKVAIVKLSSELKINDRIIFEKENGLFEQRVTSMQVERKEIEIASSGTKIGIKTLSSPKTGSPVYKQL